MKRVRIDLLHDGYKTWWEDVQRRDLEDDPTLDGNWPKFMKKYYNVNVTVKDREAEIYMLESDYVWFALKFRNSNENPFK